MMQIELEWPMGLQHSEAIILTKGEKVELPTVATELVAAGRRIDYLKVKLAEYTTAQIGELAHFLEQNLEKPIFEKEYGEGVIDSEEEIKKALSTPEAILLLALDRKNRAEKPEVVGFLVGMPAIDYGLTYDDLTPESNKPLPKLPQSETYYLHTLGVLPEARNRKVGYNLWNIFQKNIFRRTGKWESLAVLALMQKDGSSFMLRFLDRALNLDKLRSEGRVSEAVIYKFHTKNPEEVQDRLVPVHYLLIDLRGKFEKALTVYPDPSLAYFR